MKNPATNSSTVLGVPATDDQTVPTTQRPKDQAVPAIPATNNCNISLSIKSF
jgi:hypothetical protein